MTYYPLIDLLRALAVILILGYHAFPTAVPSGFVGVDIFFVISGYLITKIIISPDFTYSNFYKRRIRRLFPALLSMLTTLAAFGFLYFTPSEFYQLAKHTIASLGFFQNFVLYSEVGYFDTLAQYKPLLHLWSLSVEEQFYIVWPILILFLFKRKSATTKVLLQILIGSFWLNFVFLTDKDLSFYAPFTRIWELALGALVIFVRRDHPAILDRLRPHLAKLASVGLMFIVLFSCMYRNPASNSGVLLLVLSLAFLCLAFATDQVSSKVRIPKILIYVGLISYPLYLWHWPVLILCKSFTKSNGDETAYALLAIVLSLGLAVFTYECIEKPFKKNSKSILKILLYWSACLIFFSTIVIAFNGLPERTAKAELSEWQQTVERDCVRYKEQICIQNENDIFFDKKICEDSFNKSSLFCTINESASVAAIGDSHLQSYIPALVNYHGLSGEKVMAFGHYSTIPFVNTVSFKAKDNNGFLNFALAPNIKTVYLAASWATYFGENGADEKATNNPIDYLTQFQEYQQIYQDSSDRKNIDRRQAFNSGLVKTLEVLTKARKRVIIILDSPVQRQWKKCEPRPLDNYWGAKICSSNLEEFQNAQSAVNTAIRNVVKNFKNTTVLDPIPFMCDDKLCWVKKENIFFYSDAEHLSFEGTNYLLPLMHKAAIKP